MMEGADAAVLFGSEGRGRRMLAASASSPSSAACYRENRCSDTMRTASGSLFPGSA